MPKLASRASAAAANGDPAKDKLAAEDRDECLAAGMNDYVSKPIRVEELMSALERAAGASA